ncbi:MAG: hypothetical protein ABEJ03_06440 [Candidatus Nanohaloarchaea archaeon]
MSPVPNQNSPESYSPEGTSLEEIRQDLEGMESYQSKNTSVFVAGLNRVGGPVGEQLGDEYPEDKEYFPRCYYNNRKTWALKKELLNWMGRGNTPGQVSIDQEENEIYLTDSEHRLEYVNEALRSADDDRGEIVFVGTANFEPYEDGKKNWRKERMTRDTEVGLLNNGLKMINPPIMSDLVDNKYKFNERAKDYLPVPPFELSLKYCVRGTPGAGRAIEKGWLDEDELPEDVGEAIEMFYEDWGALEGLEVPESDYSPLFYKPVVASGGDGSTSLTFSQMRERIEKQDSGFLYQRDRDQEGNIVHRGEGILQVSVPHTSDFRVVAANDTIVQTYERIGSHEKIQTNFDELPPQEQVPQKLSENGYATPVYHLKHDEGLDGLRTMVDEGNRMIDEFLQDKGVGSEVVEGGVGNWIGWDFAAINHSHPLFRAYPDELQDYLTQDRHSISRDHMRGDEFGFESELGGWDGDRVYLAVMEANLSPGTKGDDVVDWDTQDTRKNLPWFAHEGLSKPGGEFEVGGWRDNRLEDVPEDV